MAPVDFGAFVFRTPWIASQGLEKWCAGTLQTRSAAEGEKTASSRQDVTDSSDLRATMLSHLCGSAALIAFVIEGRLNQALCST